MRKRSRGKTLTSILFSIFFIVAGIGHFVKPGFYVAIMPSYLPHPLALVYISGFFEIAGGAGLLIPALRRSAGIGLILLLIAIFPANLHMLAQHYHRDGFSLYTILLIARLPLQLVFIAIANWVSKDH